MEVSRQVRRAMAREALKTERKRAREEMFRRQKKPKVRSAIPVRDPYPEKASKTYATARADQRENVRRRAQLDRIEARKSE